MQTSFSCSHCGAKLECSAAFAGASMACPECGDRVSVPHVDLASGTTLGGFRIERLLGKGGMGRVYLAWQTSLARHVALKVLNPRLAANPEYVRQFLQEARIAGQLDHPHIVTVYDAGEATGVLYLAMAYVDGESLDDLLKLRSSLAEKNALGITLKCATGLEYAWRKLQLLHRDVKPANIMLDAAGEPKVMDMGLAQSFTEQTSLTSGGQVLGTPAYMSPEHAAGRTLDCRADMYSLGATLYHMVTGRAPFGGKTPRDVVKAVLYEPLKPPLEANPTISSGCGTLLETLLAKDPDDRYADWPAALREMERVLKGPASRKHAIRIRAAAAKQLAQARPAAGAGRGPRSRRCGLGATGWSVAILLVIIVLAGTLVVRHQRKPNAAPRPVPEQAPQASAGQDAPTGFAGARADDSDGEPHAREPVAPLRSEAILAALRQANPEAVALDVVLTRGGYEPNWEPGPQLTVSADSGLTNLAPLKGLNIAELTIAETGISDLRPLAGMELRFLVADGVPVSDLSPLRNMPLRYLALRNTDVHDLSVLRGMPLHVLDLGGAPVTSLAVLTEWEAPLQVLFADGCVGLRDLSPVLTLKGLEELTVPQAFLSTDLAFLKALPALVRIGFGVGEDGEHRIMPVEDFWKTYESQRQPPGTVPADVDPPAQLNPDLTVRRWALRFDGSDDVATCGALAYDGSHPITVEALVAFSGARSGEPRYVVTNKREGGLSIGVTDGRWVASLHDRSAQGITHVRSREGIERGVFAHVAAVWTEGHLGLFVNGVPQGAAAPGRYVVSGAPFTVGGIAESADRSGSGWFEGSIAAVRLSDSARYSDAFVPRDLRRDEKTMGLYRYEMGRGTLVRDSSGADNHGEIDGARWQYLWPLPVNRRHIRQVERELKQTNPEAWNLELIVEGLPGGLGAILEGAERLRDLGPLAALPLVRLELDQSQVRSLDPLRGKAMVWLSLCRSPVDHLGPLEGMPLRFLNLAETQVRDITPLQGMPLIWLDLGRTPVVDLEPLRDMPLEALFLRRSRVMNMQPLSALPVRFLDVRNSHQVADWHFIERMSRLEVLMTFSAASRRFAGQVFRSGEQSAPEALSLIRDIRDRIAFDLWTPPEQAGASGPHQALIRAVVDALIHARLDEAETRLAQVVSEMDDGQVADELRELLSVVRKGRELPTRIVQSFAADVGKTIQVHFRAGKAPARIVAVSSDRIQAVVAVRRGGASAQLPRIFGLEDLDVREKLARLGDRDGGEIYLMRALLAAETGRRGVAQSLLRKAHPLFEDVIGSRIFAEKAEKRERDAEAALAHLAEAMELDRGLPDIRDIYAQQEQLAAKPARLMAVRTAAEDFIERYGTTSIGRRLRPALEQIVALDVRLADDGRALTAPRILEDLRQDNPNRRDWRTARVAQADGGYDIVLGPGSDAGQLTDVDALRGVPVVALVLHGTRVADLDPLAGAPLAWLDLQYCPVGSLRAVADAPLVSLNLTGVRQAADLLDDLKSPPLRKLVVNNCADLQSLSDARGLATLECLHMSWTRVDSLNPLRSMRLWYLGCARCPIRRLHPLRGMPLRFLLLDDTQVSSIASLEGMPLEVLSLKGCRITRGLGVLEGLKQMRFFTPPANMDRKALEALIAKWPHYVGAADWSAFRRHYFNVEQERISEWRDAAKAWLQKTGR